MTEVPRARPRKQIYAPPTVAELTPSVDDSRAARLLPFVLSIIAGSVDVIGFIGLDHLFTAHITGNLVILAARVVAGEHAPVAHLLSVPVFLAALAVASLLKAGLDRVLIASLTPLLLLQFILLMLSLGISIAAGPGAEPSSAFLTFAAMLGVAAMGVQNGLVRLSMKNAPSTAVMTTNITVFTIDVIHMLVEQDRDGLAQVRARADHTWPAIAGFLLGCALGGVAFAHGGLWSLSLPAGLAFVALVLGLRASVKLSTARYHTPKAR